MTHRFAVAVMALALAGAMVIGCSKDESGQSQADQAAGELALLGDVDMDAVAVTVNGTDITNGQVANEEGRLLQQLGGRVDPQQLNQMRGMVRGQAMTNLINRRLLEDAIAEAGLTADAEEIEKRMTEIKASFGSDQAFSDRLASVGMSEEILRDEMETAVMVEKLIAEHSDLEEVTDSDVKAYYEENKERFQEPERLKASHILMAVDPNSTSAEKAVARQEAEQVLAQLESGADFAELAKTHSSCPSKDQGGDLGFFPRGQMVKPFEDAAFGLDVGELSGVVETQFGYHIIKVTDREQGRAVPFEEASERIASFLDSQRMQTAMESYTQQLRDAAAIAYPDSGDAQ